MISYIIRYNESGNALISCFRLSSLSVVSASLVVAGPHYLQEQSIQQLHIFILPHNFHFEHHFQIPLLILLLIFLKILIPIFNNYT